MKTWLFSCASAALALFLTGCSSSSSGGEGGGEDDDLPAGGLHFFLPTGEPANTTAPRLEVDAEGGTHALYPAYFGGDAYYAYCAPGCRSEVDVQVVPLPTPDGTVENVALALTAAGQPRVLLAAFHKLYYGECDARCGEAASWRFDAILDHQGEQTVSGEALALDSEGRPRFLLHAPVAYLGIGQRPPQTSLARCDANCTSAASWTYSRVAEEIWQGSQLRIDADGQMRLATVLAAQEGGQAVDTAAYLECASDCEQEDSWSGIALGPVYHSDFEAISIKPQISMALTKRAAPRVSFLFDDGGSKRLVYFACDQDCAQDNWGALALYDGDGLHSGVDVAVDGQDRPHIAVTVGYNIGLLSCADADCTAADAPWQTTVVERGEDIPTDDIFLYPNCTVAAWFLHDPSLALTASGAPRVGYQARDISGGWTNPDPSAPACVAGTDMTLSRLALLSPVR